MAPTGYALTGLPTAAFNLPYYSAREPYDMTSPKELAAENAKLKEQVAGLQKRIAELEAQQVSAAPSKSRQQAEAVKKVLDEKGVITKAELMQLNQKYPSDAIYYARSLLKVDVKRAHGAYWTPAALRTYEEGLKKEQQAKAKTQKVAEVQTPAAAQVVPPKEAVRQAAA